MVHFDCLKLFASSAKTDLEPIQRKQSKAVPITPQAYGVNLEIDDDND